MANLFAAGELINIAIREEMTGAGFYRALAEKTDSEELKQFALDVAAMEDEHAAKFRRLLDDVGDYTPTGEQYAGEYDEYISYLIEGRVFPMGEAAEEMAARQQTDLDAVEAAAEMEKNTLLLYQELIRFVREQDRPLLEAIIDEERLHLLQFTKFKEKKV
ncbi:MAG: ferritin family protein [Planctomycetota bacterium]|jgi:rubrerythrin